MDRGAAAGAEALAATRRVPRHRPRSLAVAEAAAVAVAATLAGVAAQVTAPTNANCTVGNYGLDCSWTQPASSPITQYRRTCGWGAEMAGVGGERAGWRGQLRATPQRAGRFFRAHPQSHPMAAVPGAWRSARTLR